MPVQNPDGDNLAKELLGYLQRFAKAHSRVNISTAAAPIVQGNQQPANQQQADPQQARIAILKAAQQDLLNYAMRCEKDVALELLTANLHHLCCVITQQACAIGDTVSFLELWVERMMQLVKQGGKYKARAKPEEVIVNLLSTSTAIKLFRINAAGYSIHDVDHYLPTLVTRAPEAADDPTPGLLGQQCLGAGRPFSHASHGCMGARRGNGVDRQLLLQRFIRGTLVRDNPNECAALGWQDSDFDDTSHMRVRAFSYARINKDEVVTSKMYGREVRADSSHVAVSFELVHADGPISQQWQVGKVLFFLVIEKMDKPFDDKSGMPLPGSSPLRCAIIDYYLPYLPIDDPDWGLILLAKPDRWGDTYCPTLLSQIRGKVCYTRGHVTVRNPIGRPALAGRAKAEFMLCAMYEHMSGLR
jgi:hypothetical protein